MTDAAKLDEIEREIAEVRKSPLGRRLAADACWMDMRLSDADALIAAAREAIALRERAEQAEQREAALRALIEAHNARMADGCWTDPQQPGECVRCRSGRDCPRRHMIDLPADAAVPAQGGETTR